MSSPDFPRSSRIQHDRIANLLSLRASRVYVRNLQERVPLDYLESRLRLVYSRFGNVVDVIQKRNLRAKGQAFVVFDRPEAAHQAIQETNGFDLLNNGKHMVVALAKTSSDATVERHGSAADIDTHKRHRMARKGSFLILPCTGDR